MTVRSTSAAVGDAACGGKYEFAVNSSASSTLPTATKYRPRGMPITSVPTKTPEVRVQRKETAMVPIVRKCPRDNRPQSAALRSAAVFGKKWNNRFLAELLMASR
jgi:hypothetical protein